MYSYRFTYDKWLKALKDAILGSYEYFFSVLSFFFTPPTFIHCIPDAEICCSWQISPKNCVLPAQHQTKARQTKQISTDTVEHLLGKSQIFCSPKKRVNIEIIIQETQPTISQKMLPL